MGQCLRSNGGLFYHGYAEFAEALELLLERPEAGPALGPPGTAPTWSDEYSWERVEGKIEDLLARTRLALRLQLQVEVEGEALQALRPHHLDDHRVFHDFLACLRGSKARWMRTSDSPLSSRAGTSTAALRLTSWRDSLSDTMRSAKSLSTSRSRTAVGGRVGLRRGDGAQLLELLGDVDVALGADGADHVLVGVLFGELHVQGRFERGAGHEAFEAALVGGGLRCVF